MNPTEQFPAAVQPQQSLIILGDNTLDVGKKQRTVVLGMIAAAAKFKKIEVTLTANSGQWEFAYRAAKPLQGAARLGLVLKMATLLGASVNITKDDFKPLPREVVAKPPIGGTPRP